MDPVLAAEQRDKEQKTLYVLTTLHKLKHEIPVNVRIPTNYFNLDIADPSDDIMPVSVPRGHDCLRDTQSELHHINSLLRDLTFITTGQSNQTIRDFTVIVKAVKVAMCTEYIGWLSEVLRERQHRTPIIAQPHQHVGNRVNVSFTVPNPKGCDDGCRYSASLTVQDIQLTDSERQALVNHREVADQALVLVGQAHPNESVSLLYKAVARVLEGPYERL